MHSPLSPFTRHNVTTDISPWKQKQQQQQQQDTTVNPFQEKDQKMLDKIFQLRD